VYDSGSNGSSNGSNGSGPGRPERPGVGVHWENLMSLRYWFGSLFGAVLFLFAVSLAASAFGWTLSDSLAQAAFFGFLILALVGGLVGRRYWCPHCRGMVKAGATVCRHCGRTFEV
jgi:hypothetical protein